jgi:hypothetical protein
VSEALTRAQALQMMVDTAGYDLLEQFLLDRAADHRQRLMHCKSWEEVLQHRAEASALESVLIYIEQTIREGIEEE